MNKKQKEKLINIILTLIAISFLISNIILFIKFKSNTEYNSEENNLSNQTTENETIEETIDEEENVTTMTEQQRMKYYMNNFLDKIENKEYKEAYSLLNQEFKETYFPTEESFEAYSEKNFNMSTMVVEFNNIERLGNPITGNIYVLWIYLEDALKNTPEEEKEETNFVILEKDYNQYELSFNVKE